MHIHDIRQARFIEQFDLFRKNKPKRFGFQTKFAELLKITPQYCNSIILGKQKIGNACARDIEEILGLSIGTLDTPLLSITFSDEKTEKNVRAFLEVTSGFTDEQMKHHLNLIKAVSDMGELKSSILFDIFHKHLGV